MTAVTTKCTHCAAVLKLRDTRPIGRRIRCPRCQSVFTAVASESSSGPAAPAAATPETKASAAAEILQIRTESRGSTARSVRRRKHRTLPMWLLVFGGLLVAGGVTTWLATQTGSRSSEPAVAAPAALPPAPAAAAESGPSKAPAVTTVRSPTSGSPIVMDYLPVVPQLLIHLRPSDIWAADETRQEFVGTLGDLGIWLHEFIKSTTRFSPVEIQELTIAVNFGARTGRPDYAVVARLTEEHRPSELLLERIRGTLIQDLSQEVYESEGLAFMVIDRRTVVACPADLAEDLAESQGYGAVPAPEMELLVDRSDRGRHMTVLADLAVFDAHSDLVLMPQLHQLSEDVVLWLGLESRMLSWSAHLEPHFYMETVVTHAAESSGGQLQRHLRTRLDALPQRLLTAVRDMSPQTSGRRRIVGRFPAMMQALALGTRILPFRGGVTLTTLLPRHAAGSLAAGATLTWNETVRQPGDESAPLVVRRSSQTKTVADRLNQSLLIDFRRTPLHEAFSDIAREIQVEAVIDGDALKIAGLTQNMAQTHNLGQVPARHALATILQQYDGVMVIVVDEQRGTLLLTTQEAADERGLTVFSLNPAD